MDEVYFRKIVTTIILTVLIVLSFFLLKPILLSIISGFILAFVFTPVYDWIYKKTKAKNFSAFLICIFLLVLIVLPVWFLTPIIIEESIKIYLASQQMDFVTPLRDFFPSLFASEQFSAEVGSITHSFVTNITNSLMNFLSKIILEFPTLALQFSVVIFTFFFSLRDKEQIKSYIKSLLPFSKEIEEKLFKSTKEITASVAYGQVIIGTLQGIIAGAGFIIFGAPNALVLTLLAIFTGILPIIGPTLVWLPLVVYLFIQGNTLAAVGISIFGVLSAFSDNIIRPIFVSKRTQLHPAVALVGMIGGLFFFGIIGLILGPLILAYLIIILEVYRNKKFPDVFIQKAKP